MRSESGLYPYVSDSYDDKFMVFNFDAIDNILQEYTETKVFYGDVDTKITQWVSATEFKRYHQLTREDLSKYRYALMWNMDPTFPNSITLYIFEPYYIFDGDMYLIPEHSDQPCFGGLRRKLPMSRFPELEIAGAIKFQLNVDGVICHAENTKERMLVTDVNVPNSVSKISTGYVHLLTYEYLRYLLKAYCASPEAYLSLLDTLVSKAQAFTSSHNVTVREFAFYFYREDEDTDDVHDVSLAMVYMKPDVPDSDFSKVPFSSFIINRTILSLPLKMSFSGHAIEGFESSADQIRKEFRRRLGVDLPEPNGNTYLSDVDTYLSKSEPDEVLGVVNSWGSMDPQEHGQWTITNALQSMAELESHPFRIYWEQVKLLLPGDVFEMHTRGTFGPMHRDTRTVRPLRAVSFTEQQYDKQNIKVEYLELEFVREYTSGRIKERTVIKEEITYHRVDFATAGKEISNYLIMGTRNAARDESSSLLSADSF